MTTLLNPMDREAWEKLVDAHARAVIDYNSKDGRFKFGELQEARSELIARFTYLQSQLTEARAEVERMKGNRDAAIWFLVSTIYLADSSDYKSDMLNALIRLDKDAYELLKHNERSAYEKYVEKARQPK